ncbi:MAG: hypothetical protein J3R72DRAFT_419163 [Linnemannia gamsii]|nr:MAG: hypothetical protein J3R72DRAFT_419163 [Linnemannia gamsii]
MMLAWGLSLNVLSLEGVVMDDVVGLSSSNLKLMKQRSTVDDLDPDWSEGSAEEWYHDGAYLDYDGDEFNNEEEDDSDVYMDDSDVNMDDSDVNMDYLDVEEGD